jgi:hypothetical protein
MNTKKMKILEILNDRNSDNDFVLQSSPSENTQDVLDHQMTQINQEFLRANTMALFHSVSSPVQCSSCSEAVPT